MNDEVDLKKLIRKYCWFCCLSSLEIARCKIKTCPLYKFKNGKTEGNHLLAIKKKCYDCGGKMDDCKITECVLYGVGK
jgi:hypothetical protein